MANKFIQFELWKACDNHCTFCYNYGQEDTSTKKEALEYFLDLLHSFEKDSFDEIGFIGGEFFDNQLKDDEVRKLFYSLFDECKLRIQEGTVKKIYLATALIYDMNIYLIPFLNYLRDLEILDKVLLCTSYDIKYRFHTKAREDLWKDNMLALYKIFPELRLHVETILTEYFMQAVLNNEFSITDFSNTYHTRIDYVHPQRWFSELTKAECEKLAPGFFAKKNTFTDFLIKTAIKTNEIDLSTFLSMSVRSDVFYCVYRGKAIKVEDRHRLLESSKKEIEEYCKEHSDLDVYLNEKIETGFIDSDLQMLDVVNSLKSIYAQGE